MLRFTIRRTVSFSILAAVALALVMAPAVAADKSLSESGVTGTHRLRDTWSHPGALCKYETTYQGYGAWAGKLVRLKVEPPKVWAASGTQQVGWRFMAQRKRGTGAWATTYTSPTTKTYATTSTKASFDKKSINVRVPADYGDYTYKYRVLVEMFWYGSGGGVTGSSVHKVSYYAHNYAGSIFDYRRGVCKAGESVAP